MRLIDADANKATMLKCAENPESMKARLCYLFAARILEEAPTIDAVPLSYIYKRAKELKNDGFGYASTVLNSLIANYRADGERKDGDRK